MRIVNNILELIGETPMLKLNLRNSNWNVYLKLEKFNPGGSMKDRMALKMVEDAEKSGLLKKGGTIIESSSGNTATGLAIISALKGYRFIAVVDYHASKEKIDTIKAYGGEIVKVGRGKKPDEVAAAEREKAAAELAKTIDNAFFSYQTNNESNKKAYENTLAKELINDLKTVDEFYAAIGTGGSACGTAMGLKKYNKNTVINVIEPIGSTIFNPVGAPYFQSGTGIPEDADIPKIIDFSLIDHNFYASDKEAFNTCRYFAKKHGILIGGSADGVLYKAIEDIVSKSGEGNAVILLCDGGEKYLNNIFNDEWMRKNNLFDADVEKQLSKWIKE